MDNEDLLKQQYMKYPYPPIPIGEMEDEVLYSSNYEYSYYICTKTYRKNNNIKILDAGCGTGYSTMKLAEQNPDAEIVAIDISSNSIDIARERLKKANLYSDRITFFTADLEDLSFLNKKFDYIVSTGVIHHLKNPEIGLKNLQSKLSENGIINMMLYSKYGRHALQLFRQMIDLIRKDKNNFEEGVKIGKEILNILPDNHIIKANYLKSYKSNLSVFGEKFANSDIQFVDAYLNAREKSYNIQELFKFLDDSNLKLIKFLDDIARNKEGIFNNNQFLYNSIKDLSKEELYKVSEILHPERNFAFFCSHKSLNIENNKKEIKNFKLTKFNKKIDNIIMSATGKGLQLTGMYKSIYEEMEKENNIDNIYKNIAYKSHSNLDDTKKIVSNFINALDDCDLIYLF